MRTVASALRDLPTAGPSFRLLLLACASGLSGATACGSSTAEPQAAPVAALEVQGPDASTYAVLDVGQTVQFVARPLDRSGEPVQVADPTWSTSNPAVATVDGTGLVAAVGEGVTKITATLDTLSAYQPVLVGISGTGVHLDCEATQDVAAARERLATVWFDQPYVQFTAVSPGGLAFNFTNWRFEGRVCLSPYYFPPGSDYVRPVDLILDFPGGASFLSFDMNQPGEYQGGWIADATVSFADGSTETFEVVGEPEVEGPGFQSGTLATLDLTDETGIIDRVHVEAFYLVHYGNLRFFSGTP